MEVTITKENFAELKAGNLPLVVDFWATWCGPCRMVGPIIDELAKRDCKALFFVEYTPIDEQSEALALDDDDRALLEARIGALREKRQDMLYFSFPGDEKFTGGCLAAGRGFFHINATGGAEPCPFSPYSDTNVAETSLKESLHSRLFTELHDGGLLAEEHIGGCALFKQKAKIEEILGSTK